MKRLNTMLFLGLLSIGLVSCVSSGKPESEQVFSSGDQTPRDTLRNFRKTMRKDAWQYVHVLLSERARSCYSQDRLKTFLTRTIPGALERLRLHHWNVKSIEPGDNPDEARLTLVHPRDPDFTQTYRMIREDEYWRIDWSMADVLNVPRSVEYCP